MYWRGYCSLGRAKPNKLLALLLDYGDARRLHVITCTPYLVTLIPSQCIKQGYTKSGRKNVYDIL